MTYLAVPIAAPNLAQAEKQIDAACAVGAEMLELRTDYLEEISVELVKQLIASAKRAKAEPLGVIVTCRDREQGGANDYPLSLRTKILTEAVKAGADFIDCEYDNFCIIDVQEKIQVALAESWTGRLILSAHNFEGKFANLNKLYRSILAVYPAAIPKVVYRAGHINDCFEAFDLLSCKHGPAIVWAMGEAGLASRIIAKKLDSFVTFASLDEASATAPGQLTIDELKGLYSYDSIDADTELFGVIASPVSHSLSPTIFNACFADVGFNKLYLPLLVDGSAAEFNLFLHKIVKRDWLGFRGFSVTIPHKRNALDYIKKHNGLLEPLAEKIGAVNTLTINADGRTSGYNTDYAGALDAITSALGGDRGDLEGLSVAVIGAGGVARAVVAGLTEAWAEVTIYNRTVKKGEKLAEEFGCKFGSLDDLPDLEAKLLINCTSVGMYPDTDQMPLPAECIKKNMIVFDTVYNPAETLLLQQAGRARAKTINGLEMFINQASAQFKIFTGQEADPKLMRKTIFGCLAE